MLDGEFARRSLRSMLGYVSPMRFEENWHAAIQNRPRNRVAMVCVEQGQGHVSPGDPGAMFDASSRHCNRDTEFCIMMI